MSQSHRIKGGATDIRTYKTLKEREKTQSIIGSPLRMSWKPLLHVSICNTLHTLFTECVFLLVQSPPRPVLRKPVKAVVFSRASRKAFSCFDGYR